MSGSETIKNASGAEVVRYTYDAWGKLLETTGELASTLGYLNPLRYRGYVYDEETGLYYLRSRYYNPSWNRFVNADRIIKGNLFEYCDGNPQNNYDPEGYYSLCADNQAKYKYMTDSCGGGGGGGGIILGLGVLLSFAIGNTAHSLSPKSSNSEIDMVLPAPGPAPQPLSTPAPVMESSTSIAITAATTVMELDQTEVEKGKKPQYWAARVNKDSGFVMASVPLTYSMAHTRMMMGGDVLAITQAAALALVGPTGNYIDAEIHTGDKGYYLPHYHVRHGMGHVFYLVP